jgi:hypothetical protein
MWRVYFFRLDKMCLHVACRYKNDIPKAIERGLTDENAVNKAVRRILWNIFTAGIYDKVSEDMPWAELGTGDAIGSDEHNTMNYEMALQGHILCEHAGACGQHPPLSL